MQAYKILHYALLYLCFTHIQLPQTLHYKENFPGRATFKSKIIWKVLINSHKQFLSKSRE